MFTPGTPSCPNGITQLSGMCLVTKWGTPGSANGQFNFGYRVALYPSTHNVYVADMHNNRIQVFFWKTDVRGPSGGTNAPH